MARVQRYTDVPLILPVMRGDEFSRRLRQREPEAKVLYFTGYPDQLFEDRRALWEREAFLEKPVTIQALREAVSLLVYGHVQHP
jgi:FixJ family two-component response regulator